MLKSNDQQELFDMALNGVIAQGKPSWSEYESSCMYMMYDDASTLKCGVGHCLTDEAMSIAQFSTAGISDLICDVAAAGIEDSVPDNVYDLLEELQEAHDLAKNSHGLGEDVFIKAFKSNMRKVAEDHNLKMKV